MAWWCQYFQDIRLCPVCRNSFHKNGRISINMQLLSQATFYLLLNNVKLFSSFSFGSLHAFNIIVWSNCVAWLCLIIRNYLKLLFRNLRFHRFLWFRKWHQLYLLVQLVPLFSYKLHFIINSSIDSNKFLKSISTLLGFDMIVISF